MKIAIGYPPLESPKGTPLLSQNRQFQWFSNKLTAYAIYPVVMASAATLLKSKGYDVVWLDGVAEKWTQEQFLEKLKKEKPDLIVFEVKTPVIKKYWQLINQLKKLQTPGFKPQTVLLGDHVTALPQESMENSKVDFILTGGDYDFALLNLVDYLTKGTKLSPGVWYRTSSAKPQASSIVNTGHFQLNHNLDSLPLIDRDLTRWQLYSRKNSNFYRTPGAYTMFGRDCWWGKCIFCSWTTIFPGKSYRHCSVKKALDEIGHLIEKYQVREIMDDSGTFPVGDWLREFCQGMIKRGYNKKIRFNCNMRFNAGLNEKDYQLMGKAGFRFILYGLESANQKTLDRINKNSRVEMIEPVLTWAVKAGLMPHITVMVGYPWEDKEDVQKTLNLARELFKKGLVFTMQATVVIPYPGTPLFSQCQKNHWLKTEDWDRYDMREPIMKTKLKDEELMACARSLYASFASPQFIWRTLSSIRNFDDIKYVSFQGLKFLSKLADFGKK